jgi:UPF0755 protein
MRRKVTLFAIALLAGALLLATVVYRWWHAPLAVPVDGLRVDIAPGETLGALSARMAGAGILANPQWLNVAARLRGDDARIRSGEYRIREGTTPETLLELLTSNATLRYRVTLPEGITLAAALARLREAEGLVAVLSGVDDARLLELVAPHAVAEGLFLPETYQYERGDRDLDVLRQAHRLMNETLLRLWAARDPASPLKTPYEALILASIIERETGVGSERPEIAGVFSRRLERGMRLQTDPTVIYGLGPRFDGNLTRAHLRDDRNAYNTYRHPGLPPGPIALPGRAALAAALHPAQGDTLYFVARGDGSHEFTSTLEAHQQAVRRYQLQRRADYRSSPTPGEG